MLLNKPKSYNMKEGRKYDLEERLIEFAVLIIRISESFYNTKAGIHIGGQVVRSGTSPALHYGEAQSAESRADFVHKLKILLKELRETKNALRISKAVPLTDKTDLIEIGLKEVDELISIFVKSIDTAKKNMITEKSKRTKEKDTQ
jgi:four helix bundle protein